MKNSYLSFTRLESIKKMNPSIMKDSIENKDEKWEGGKGH